MRVNNPDGQQSNARSFAVTGTAPAPAISSVSPSSYPGSGSNQAMSIFGSGFVNGATLTFDPPTGSNINSTASKLTFISTTQINYLFTPAGDTGTWTVRVNNPDGQQSNARSFAVTGTAPAPAISSVSPSSYPGSGSNQAMSIFGSGFVNGATLTFDPPTGSNINSTASKLTFISNTQINYLFTPAGDTGTWTVRVNNPDGQQSSPRSFSVQ